MQTLLFLLPLLTGFNDVETGQPDALENALWRGELRVQVNGPMFTQYLANNLNETGQVVGFVKEKGSFKIDMTLIIRFLLNAVGESSMAAAETFKGDYMVDRESRIHFREEIILKKQRTSYMQDVHISETYITKIPFDRERDYSQEDFRFGNLRFLPSGRMDNKGQVQILADLRIPVTGAGERVYTRERQPESDKDPNERTVAEVKKTVMIPVVFEVNINHRKDPVSGTFPVTVDITTPFPSEDEEDAQKRTFRPKLTAQGSYSMSPLFDKKKKKKRKR
ncbi:MAG: hypothetical protein QNK37_23270 [Acidobacteriota bacterium]|nr:hypothetical protein [Acidobacteriota bacterium]